MNLSTLALYIAFVLVVRHLYPYQYLTPTIITVMLLHHCLGPIIPVLIIALALSYFVIW